MTPRAQSMNDRFGWVADQVAAQTGIDRTALLIQWSIETAFGSQINNQNNLGNIRCLHSGVWGFCQYPSLEAFIAGAVQTWHNGYYADVLARSGHPLQEQLRAIGACPWDAGHYDFGEGPGSSLLQVAGEFDVQPSPAPEELPMAAVDEIMQKLTELENRLATDEETPDAGGILDPGNPAEVGASRPIGALVIQTLAELRGLAAIVKQLAVNQATQPAAAGAGMTVAELSAALLEAPLPSVTPPVSLANALGQIRGLAEQIKTAVKAPEPVEAEDPAPPAPAGPAPAPPPPPAPPPGASPGQPFGSGGPSIPPTI